MNPSNLQVVDRFAKALDHEDYALAVSLLSPVCVYRIRGGTIEGAHAVVDSYRRNGEAAHRFDEIAYGSDVNEVDDAWVVIAFWDEITHKGRTHRHACEQWVRVVDGTIVVIEHRDLEGERERLESFKEWAGIEVA